MLTLKGLKLHDLPTIRGGCVCPLLGIGESNWCRDNMFDYLNVMEIYLHLWTMRRQWIIDRKYLTDYPHSRLDRKYLTDYHHSRLDRKYLTDYHHSRLDRKYPMAHHVNPSYTLQPLSHRLNYLQMSPKRIFIDGKLPLRSSTRQRATRQTGTWRRLCRMLATGRGRQKTSLPGLCKPEAWWGEFWTNSASKYSCAIWCMGGRGCG